jgi:hypothetical protein
MSLRVKVLVHDFGEHILTLATNNTITCNFKGTVNSEVQAKPGPKSAKAAPCVLSCCIRLCSGDDVTMRSLSSARSQHSHQKYNFGLDTC